MINGKYSQFHFDNVNRYNNKIIKSYLQKESIDVIYCIPHHPQSNGCVERLHYDINNTLKKEYDPKNFSIEIALLNAINYQNSNIHSTTEYGPNDIRNITDKELVDKIKENIKKI